MEIAGQIGQGNLGGAFALADEVVARARAGGGDPAGILLGIASELLVHGHADSARAVVLRALGGTDTTAMNASAMSISVEALGLIGRWDEAAVAADSLVVLSPESPAALGLAGVAAANRGDRARATEMDTRLAALTTPYIRGVQTRWRARIAAQLGDREQAVALLRRALAEGSNFGVAFHQDHYLSSLTGFAPFEEFRNRER
jgi:tetratricopeptide (TPR) repeat protein